MIDWLMAALGALATFFLLMTLGYLGGLRRWKRIPWGGQLLLMVLLPMLLDGLVLGILVTTMAVTLEQAAGLLIGVAGTALLMLVATSYLIDQIREAFAPENPGAPSNDDKS